MTLVEQLINKWKPVLTAESAGKITDPHRLACTAILLENQERALREEKRLMSGLLAESAPTNSTGSGIANWDPILISLVRRSMPNLVAYDWCGVQPMTGPTGLVFALRSRYTSQSGTEALFNEADTTFSGNNAGQNLPGQAVTNGGGTPMNDPVGAGFPPIATQTVGPNTISFGPNGALGATGTGMSTAQGEALGDGSAGNNFAEMAFSIEKVQVTAKTRKLKAEYSMEASQDLKAVHGLDMEGELANVLSAEILTEQNRELVRTVYWIAKTGAQTTTTPGIFDLDVDSNGRWSVEKFKGLLMQLEREANQIAKDTRRGRGNIAIMSSDAASALSMAGVLDYAPALSTNLQVDDTGNLFAGTLQGRIRVYIDPYFGGTANGHEFACMGYKGTSPYDAGLYYCPYVPLQMVRAVGEQSFQPKIGFTCRYGLVENPFYSQPSGQLTANANPYYRLMRIANLM